MNLRILYERDGRAIFASTLRLSIAVCAVACGEPRASAEATANHVVLSASADSVKIISVGDSLPELRIRMLTGDTLVVGGAQPKPLTLVNLWATWCGPCKREYPAIQHLHDTYAKRGLRVVAVSTDRDDRAVQSYLMTTSFTVPVGRDSANEVLKAIRGTGLPQNLLLSRQGKVL